MTRTLLSSALLCGLLAVSACKKAVPEVDVAATQPKIVLLNAPHDPIEERTVILRELQEHSWSTEGENGPQILARLNHKGTLIRVAVDYEPQRITIRATEAEGTVRNFEGYMGKLERGIRDALNKTVTVAAPPPVIVAPPMAVTPPPTLVVFERVQPTDKVVPAIQRALAKHSWVLESQQPDGVIARLNHRKGLVRVRITADAKQASIAYLDSQELSFDSNGRSDEYEKWMRNLSEAIRENTR